MTRSMIDSLIELATMPLILHERVTRDRRNLDIVLSWTLKDLTSNHELVNPVEFVDLLRDSLEKKQIMILEIKSCPPERDLRLSKRFQYLVNQLKSVPPLNFESAKHIALVADSVRRNLKSTEQCVWAQDMDAAYNFQTTSSFGTKGRILDWVVGYTRSRNCLELGTAFGMSAIFILEALKRRDEDRRLTTLEGDKTLFDFSRHILENSYPEKVNCVYGLTGEVLPQIIQSVGSLDFFFHDNGHSKEAYINDFMAVLPILTVGAVVLIDDIHWNEGCYEGWREIVNHQKVLGAIEIMNSMGLLMVG